MATRLMESQENTANRRKQLRRWIEDRYGGVQSMFVDANKLTQSEISGLLRARPFGSAKARNLEAQCNMPSRYLELRDDDPEPGAPREKGGLSFPLPKDHPRSLFGRRMARARKEAGLSQSAVGKHLEIYKNTVSAWERSEGLPDALRLLEVAKLYKLTPNDLLLESAQRPSPRAMELARAFDACQDEAAKDMAESAAMQCLGGTGSPKAPPAANAPQVTQPKPDRVRNR